MPCVSWAICSEDCVAQKHTLYDERVRNCVVTNRGGTLTTRHNSRMTKKKKKYQQRNTSKAARGHEELRKRGINIPNLKADVGVRKKDNFDKYLLKKVDESQSTEGAYLYHGFHSDKDVRHEFVLGNKDKLINTSDYTVFDAREKHLVLIDEDSGKFITGKISREHAKRSMPIGQAKTFRKMWKKIQKMKSDVGRGKGRSGKNFGYKCFGYRRAMTDKHISRYAFKAKFKTAKYQDLRNDIESFISNVVASMERGVDIVYERFRDKLQHDLENIQECTDLPFLSSSNRGKATQFSIGYKYWSKVHTDKDYFFTVLSGLSEKVGRDDDILFYFCFPQYKVKIPVRPRDVLLFNPLVPHSCSEPSSPETLIFSAYVSSKTVDCNTCDKLNVH